MAIFHLSVKTISRSSGRSAPGAAAYRAAAKIAEIRTGIVHDYTRKKGVEFCEIVLPSGAPEEFRDRGILWNAAESSETRKNSTVAREFEVALPVELSPEQRVELVRDFAKAIVARHLCAVDFAIHAPGGKGDPRNFHAHVLCTTRRIWSQGFGEKTRELDDRKTGEVAAWRKRWEELENRALEKAQVHERVSCTTLEDQEIEREPGFHHGPAITGILRRREFSYVFQRAAPEARRKLEAIRQERLEREISVLEKELDVLVWEHSAEIARSAWKDVQEEIESTKNLELARQEMRELAQKSLREILSETERSLERDGPDLFDPGM